ncbi:condensation domain-containing protein [Pseudomonas sp. PCH446]
MPRALYNRLGELAKASSQATVFHVMLGALYSYFTRVAQRDELVIGLPVLNRANAAHKATLGLFVGMSPARLSLGTDLGFSELVSKIALTLKQDYRYQRFPLSELNRELGLQNLGRASCSTWCCPTNLTLTPGMVRPRAAGQTQQWIRTTTAGAACA